MTASVSSDIQSVVDRLETRQGRPRYWDWLGPILLFGFFIMALIPGIIAPYDPLEQNVVNRLQPPSIEHIFGTDELGRDIFSRIVYGARVSLVTALIAVCVSVAVGVPIGLLSGYSGGVTDDFFSRATDILLSFPAIVVAMTLIAIAGQSLVMVGIVIGVVSIPAFVRISRAITLELRDLPYVDAVRTAGASGGYIMFRTILPNLRNAIFIQLLLIASRAIVIESGLSFLGLGVPPPAPTWGAMLSKSRGYFYQTPTYGIFPGLFIVLLVIALQLTSSYLQKRSRS